MRANRQADVTRIILEGIKPRLAPRDGHELFEMQNGTGRFEHFLNYIRGTLVLHRGLIKDHFAFKFTVLCMVIDEGSLKVEFNIK